jgi:hypothetical protein
MIATARRASARRSFLRPFALAGLVAAAFLLDPTRAAAQFGADGQLFIDPEVASYRLTADGLDRFVRATDAIRALGNIEIGDELDMDNPSDADLSAITAALDREPRVREALASAGMETREYVTFMLAAVQTMISSMMIQLGGEQALNDIAPGVLRDNIRFFLDNGDAFRNLGG